MSSFLPVNNVSSPADRVMEGSGATSATPRPHLNHTSATPGAETSTEIKDERFSRRTTISDGSRASTHSMSDETIQAESDGDRDGSDHDTDHKEHAPPSKKKKGQRFYCTEFPPCNLSFTRSEHLARHIRKHTGERPFQCHCSRRFSRLDNLRQHAQTVHVNEEIPGDSLAATGTRFQRQIRTDRVRPQGRARAGTGGSQGTHSRGHSRNLSTSSITSTASTFSQPAELRRRPAPQLMMATDGGARTRLTLDPMVDTPTTPPGQVRGLPGAPGSSPYTPSRMFPGSNASPMPASHPSNFWDGKTAARRLSVPSGVNPFAPHHYPAPYPSSTYAGPEVYASPINTHNPLSRDDGGYHPTEAELRRRTWHPSTWANTPRAEYGSIGNAQTPETFPPASGGNESAGQPPRLPGIESFDKVVAQRPLTPPIRRPSPMQVDAQSRPLGPGYNFSGGFNYAPPSTRPAPPISGPGHRRGHVSWDLSLHTNLTGLQIRDKPVPQRDASHWGQQTISEIHNVGSRPSSSYQQQLQEFRGPNSHTSSTYSTATSGSLATRTSPEDSSSSEGVNTPSTASLEYHPAIVHNNGYVEPHHPSFPSDSSQTACPPLPPQHDAYHAKSDSRPDFSHPSRDPGMGRLEALVAVATSENKNSANIMV
ncbi:Putative C2H2 transcription factor [Aspergillus calidoustus]|uniref:Putative C2H2 transcription factor n=1 Tax=Aspergillus calidoustus TaxID=454130 RepID=A0A0U5GAE2_ASPCI|nr:Putative C2H2 transcription factor [Aspergillus calidoustus]